MTAPTYSRADFQTDQEVRWCPGCGDYTILAAVQGFMAGMGVPREKIVFVSGIGCSSRFPYYMNTYGMHSIHGRAPAIASGIAATRQDLSVWVVTGDGDALSIGGNHLIHALRRNFNLKILLFNNQIYGLTKGQYSPTSEVGKQTKSTPMGSVDYPFNPISLALGAEASFVARTIDMDRTHTTEILKAAQDHQGTAFIEIYQNCNVFNDKAFVALTGKDERAINRIDLVHGKPITFGPSGDKGVIFEDGRAQIVDTSSVESSRILVHDHNRPDPTIAFALSRLSHGPYGPTPVGIFRSVRRPMYETGMNQQLVDAQGKKGPGDLAQLISSAGTWEVK
ncbi:MAG: 2-oxoacid:ferredoxin oxidoreductase subunit beta [Acidimicrobiia bacterium]